jgi:Tol biopolymer transport system component
LSNPRKQRRAADRESATARMRSLATSGGGGWGPVISVGVALVVLLSWLTWYALGQRPITRDGSPSWSSDATAVVFDAEQNDRRDIAIMNADGTRVRPVSNVEGADEAAPTWSRDGLIAYEAEVDGNRDIYVVDATGSRKQRLTSEPADDRSPAWSPDGQRLIFISDRDSKPAFDLYLMHADGSGVERLTITGNNRAPQFSPDGAQIAFQSGRDVYVIELATRALRRLTSERQSGDGMHPTWSPDGKRIAFMTARAGRMQLWAMNADGTDQRELLKLPTGSAIEPRWSPKDNRLLFVRVPDDAPPIDRRAMGERAIYLLDIDSGKVARLSR